MLERRTVSKGFVRVVAHVLGASSLTERIQ